MTIPLWMRVLRLYGKQVPINKGKARLAKALFQRLPLPDTPTVAPLFSGNRIELWPWLWADFSAYTVGGPEIYGLDYFRSLIHERSVVLDIGAYIGLYTFAVAALAPQGKVVAFEPDPRSAKRFAAALERTSWKHVELCPQAVGANETATTLTLGAYPPQSSLQGAATPQATEQHRVQQTTLDSYCTRAGLRRVDVIKIDTEGAELNVLRGARETLAAWRPLLLVELHAEQSASFGHTVQDTIAALRAMDYELFQIEAGLVHAKLSPLPTAMPGRSLVVARPLESR